MSSERLHESQAASRRRWSWTIWALLVLLAANLLTQLTWARQDLNSRRFVDERTGLENVRGLVVEGQLRPVYAFYPSLSYLPYTPLLAASEALYQATGVEELRIFDAEKPRWVSRTGYFLGRLVSVIAGTMSLALTYLLGRRLLSPSAGLLAACLLSLTWGFLLVSIKIKPDVLVVLVSLIAFWWILDALDKPTARRFALAGLGIGLAAATKYYPGATAAAPLAVSALAFGGRLRATWGRLALAGITSMVTFFALNPWPGRVLELVVFQHEGYARKQGSSDQGHFHMLRREADWLLEEHGALVVAFLVVGGVGLAARAAGRRSGPDRRREALALLTMILGHLLFFAGATTHFVFWNFVPVIPFTSLVAAWAMVGLSESAVSKLSAGGRWMGRAVIWAPVAGLVLWLHVSRTYGVTVPTTLELAQRHLSRFDTTRMRVVYQEPLGSDLTLVSRRNGPVILALDSVAAAPAELLRRADAVVFRASRLESSAGPEYSRFLDTWDGPVIRVEPRWFRARGPPLVLMLGEWRPVGEPTRFSLEAGKRRHRLALPEPLERGEVVSIAVKFQSPELDLLPAFIDLGARDEVALHALPGGSRRPWMVTRKLRLGHRTEALSLELPELSDQVAPLAVELRRWRRGGP